MWTWLKGKKTYLIAAGTAIGAVARYWNGDINLDTLNLALAGAAASTGLRHGITTTTLTVVETLARNLSARTTSTQSGAAQAAQQSAKKS